MLVGLVCALGEAQLMPIYHRLRGETSERGMRRGVVSGGFPSPSRLVGVRGASVPQVSPYLYEAKYLIESHRLPEIESALGDLLVPDPNALSEDGTYNHSIYFDSPDYQAYIQARGDERVTVRPRIRAYRRRPGAADAGIYLELKRRYDRVIAKRRTRIRRDLAEGLLSASAPDLGDATSMSSVRAEFQFLVQRFALRPSLSVLYHRSGYFASPDQDVRVTIDRLVQHGPSSTLDAPLESFSCALPPDRVVLEVKYGEEVPATLLGRLRQLDLHPQGFSKYACALEARGGGAVEHRGH